MSESESTIPVSGSSQVSRGYKLFATGSIVGGRYRILRQLGSGGFSITYLAEEINTDSSGNYVVKHLQLKFDNPFLWQNAKVRFNNEAKALQRLGNHPQIPRLVDYFEEDREFFLIQEFVEGEELRQEINRQVLSEIEAINLFDDILQILEFVHQEKVIHRDIKPSNLIRRKDGKIVLIDFGAVKEIGTITLNKDGETTQTQIIGTPGYMAPEQNNGKPIYSSDLFALGRTIIFALTGRSPGDLESSDNSNFLAWEKLASVQPALAAIINKSIASQTLERYVSATQVRQDLQPLKKINQIIQGKYQIINYLGSGVIGHSYLAKKISNNSHCIVKLLKENNYSYFKNNKFPNNLYLNKIQECFSVDNEYYLIQEYIEGQPLSDLIEEKVFLKEQEAIYLVRELLQILESLHKQNIFHHNLKPSNIIQRQIDNKLVLIDFFPDDSLSLSQSEAIKQDLRGLSLSLIAIFTHIYFQENITINWQDKITYQGYLPKILDKIFLGDYSTTSQILRELDRKKIFGLLVKFFSNYKYIIIGLVTLILLLFARYFWFQYQAILLFEQADIRLESKQYQKALEYYQEGIEKVGAKTKQFERAWLGKAMALSQLKRHQEMLNICQEIIEANSKSFNAWNCRGLALAGLEKYQEAILAYDRAISLEQNFFDAWNNRGDSYRKLGKKEQALENFNRAILLDSDGSKSFVVLNNLGQLYYQFAEYQEALKAYEEALEKNNNYIPAWLGLGNSQRQIKKYQNAIDSYEMAIKLDRKNHEAWYLKGLLQEEIKDYSNALYSYKQALKFQPDYPPAKKGLERINQLSNDRI